MKDLIRNIISNPDAYPYVPRNRYVPCSIDVESPFDRVRASGVAATGENYQELADLVVAEFRKVFEEIETHGFSWDLRFDLDENQMHLQVYLTHANGLPDGKLPDLDHPTNALWDALGMGHYDKHSRVGHDTEVRMWMVNLDERFS